MTTDALTDFYTRFLETAERGDEEATKAFLQTEFAKLPTDLQGELLTRLYFKAAQEEADDADLLAHVQSRAIEAIDTLEDLKKTL